MEIESLIKTIIQYAYNVRMHLAAGFLEAVQNLIPIHETQLVNYLTATNTCLLYTSPSPRDTR